MAGLSIAQLNLNHLALQGAHTLYRLHPTVVFTSGKRDLWGQAHAMAVNVALQRDWIRQTYAHAAQMQTWVDQHPEAVGVDQLAVGFHQVLLSMNPEEQNLISRHLSGDAFDVQPMVGPHGVPTEEGFAVLATIRGLDGLDKFLTKEGQLLRWHVQFTPSAEV